MSRSNRMIDGLLPLSTGYSITRETARKKGYPGGKRLIPASPLVSHFPARRDMPYKRWGARNRWEEGNETFHSLQLNLRAVCWLISPNSPGFDDLYPELEFSSSVLPIHQTSTQCRPQKKSPPANIANTSRTWVFHASRLWRPRMRTSTLMHSRRSTFPHGCMLCLSIGGIYTRNLIRGSLQMVY